jgi:hypothetical protein
MPVGSLVDRFHFDTSKWRLLYFQSATGWRFIGVVGGAGGEKVKMVDERALIEYYEKIFVPAVIYSPVYYKSFNDLSEQGGEGGLERTTRLFFASSS